MTDLAASPRNHPSGFHLIGFHVIALGFLRNCLFGLLLSHWQKATREDSFLKQGLPLQPRVALIRKCSPLTSPTLCININMILGQLLYLDTF